jgi:hypothetical protein
VIFHFEFSGDRGWEAMGSGEGAGAEALPLALADLRSLHGGRLPAGRYQYIPAGGETRWVGFELGEAGEVVG